MNVLIGSLILAWLLIGCVLAAIDICAECRFQTAAAEHDELLDELWADE